MKKLLRKLGYISLKELSLYAERYDWQQINRARAYFEDNEDEEGRSQFYKGCGALEFTEQLLDEQRAN